MTRQNSTTLTELGPQEGDREALLGFYDRLRDRIARQLADRASWGGAAAEALMLVPDVFILLVRLTLDRSVPADTRRLLGGALAYFVLPVDLFPEMIVGAGGYLEDLVLAAVVLSQALGDDLEAHAERHWSGSGGVRRALSGVTRAAEELLGPGLGGRLERLLARRGFRRSATD